jgi:Lrp/AsnC family transcriptional regulator, leucine-responsive regulatory protein
VAVLDHRIIGVPNVVFVEVTLDRHDKKVLEQFGRALAEIPEIIEAYLVTGDYDYLVKVTVVGTEHYERFLRESLYRIPGIRHSRSIFALRSLKASGFGGSHVASPTVGLPAICAPFQS